MGEVHIPYLSQTPAMDMWSLGVVTTVMLSAGLDIEDAITGISRCDQDTLLERLQQHIFPPSLKLSQNGKAFVWQCLQVSPQDRMTVFEAQWHDWMRTPESHLQFFERLDQNILGDWQARAEASPMPLQLPSVLMSSLNETQDQDKLLKSYARLSHRYPLLQTEFSNYFRPSMPEYESQTGVCDGQLHSIAEHEEAGESWHETPSSAAASESSATELDNEDIATIRGFTRSEPSYTKQNKAHRAFDPLVEGEINAQKNENMFPYSTEI
ncbi:hypothetical protein QQS21_003622 [Conoideocrella luteorostrata]|uniref:Protein kinase domain-containing protein n=1 Tax=Conoideocrella luteorostrata TaxID=1105319 RepID=A0AAJ0CSZ4_9HYPO|nr:hypothetical protein QQS21_003622 [Conoideocrella luteorostrata]